MKFLRTFSPLLLILQLPSAVADVYETNTYQNYVKKFVMRSTITCPQGYNTTFTCEHYMNYGDTIAFTDNSPSGCNYVYSPESSSYIPSALFRSFSSVVRQPGPVFGYSPTVEVHTQNELKGWIRSGLGWPTDANTDLLIHKAFIVGCNGLPMLAMTRWIDDVWGQIPILPEPVHEQPEYMTTVSEHHGPLYGYLTFQDAQNDLGCPGDMRPVYFAKIGKWAGGSPPTKDGNNRIPTNSVHDILRPDDVRDFAYWTLINGKWVTLEWGTGALNQPHAPNAYYLDTPPRT